ncbi:YkvA family protein [Cytobacillus sp. FSL H8-0458]|uniref:YkvA family protein n=1 Tax=Cytobacillus sp. FSL H8-0458 TaxID=2975346 RepID=UPI0030FA3F85
MKFLKRIKFVFKFWKFLPFLRDYFLSKEVSAGKKLFPVAAGLLYILLPLDLVPDFLSIFGFTDDIVITSFVLQQMVKMAPESLKEKYKVLEE